MLHYVYAPHALACPYPHAPGCCVKIRPLLLIFRKIRNLMGQQSENWFINGQSAMMRKLPILFSSNQGYDKIASNPISASKNSACMHKTSGKVLPFTSCLKQNCKLQHLSPLGIFPPICRNQGERVFGQISEMRWYQTCFN